ncbi:NADPH:quinone reductase [Solicola gregarius]|uniref:NADPH:quinone reductase n=1 Tax=Solicola gregarius TaxID=2908642 RepID=A0AA46TL28_9ACTN|nr:NADPH:quinone reductase [Solicola gregarius]UYM07240.1 NADPH:quinone reductase [Solicola gregarius]
MDTMPAAYIESLGPPESIRFGELPVPRPGPTDVLVEVEATTVDPVDTLVRSGVYPTPTPFPFVIGRDLAGTVVAAGAGTGFTIGDQVWCNSLGHGGRQGTFAKYAVVPESRLYRLPAGVEPTAAVSVAHPAATAYLGWFVHAGLRAGQTVYVGGAAGNVGRAALAMATYAGARVVASARPDDHDWCLAAGADKVLDYRDPDLGATLAVAAPSGFDVFWDTSGRQDVAMASGAVAIGGRVLMSAAGAGDQRLPARGFYTRDVSLHGFVISRASVPHLAAAAAMINDLLSRDLLDVRIADELPLTDAAAAHARIEAGDVRGRLIVRP